MSTKFKEQCPQPQHFVSKLISYTKEPRKQQKKSSAYAQYGILNSKDGIGVK